MGQLNKEVLEEIKKRADSPGFFTIALKKALMSAL